MRRLLPALLATAVLPLSSPVAAVAPGDDRRRGPDVFPDRIALPVGFQSEGIEAGRGTTVYVGLAPGRLDLAR